MRPYLTLRPYLALPLVVALAACAGRPDTAPPPAETQAEATPAEAPAPAANPAIAEMDAIADAYWAELMRVAPTWASYRGDRSRDAELPDYSAAARAKHDEIARGLLTRAEALDAAALDDRGRLSRATLIERLKNHFAERETCQNHSWAVDQLGGPQNWLGQVPSYHVVDGEKRARDLITRYRAIPTLFDQHMTNLRGGLKAGRTAARINVTRVIAQLDRIAGMPLAEDPFLARPKAQAAKLESPPYAEFDGELADAVENHIRPALAKYRTFLVDEILPASRTQPGIGSLPGGAACYAVAVARHTGLDLSADAIHQIGLDEVRRIRAGMQAVAEQMGHPDVDTALAALAADPAQKLDTEKALLDYNEALLERVRARLPDFFGRVPKTPVELKPIEAFRAPDAPAAYYYSAPDDGSRPAYYYLNTHDPQTRLLYKMPALAWHEAMPGHHLQIALAKETVALPTFMQNTGFTAFTEGWALYTELLADEMGLYETPAERMGAYTYEIWRAARLVIDTGLHHKGWTRQQAIDYLQTHTGHIEEEVINEIDRYIVWPGQALAYKLGQLEISKLRATATKTLGAHFDLKAWHDRVLRDGGVPISVLKREMAAWLAAEAEVKLAE